MIIRAVREYCEQNPAEVGKALRYKAVQVIDVDGVPVRVPIGRLISEIRCGSRLASRETKTALQNAGVLLTSDPRSSNDQIIEAVEKYFRDNPGRRGKRLLYRAKQRIDGVPVPVRIGELVSRIKSGRRLASHEMKTALLKAGVQPGDLGLGDAGDGVGGSVWGVASSGEGALGQGWAPSVGVVSSGKRGRPDGGDDGVPPDGKRGRYASLPVDETAGQADPAGNPVADSAGGDEIIWADWVHDSPSPVSGSALEGMLVGLGVAPVRCSLTRWGRLLLVRGLRVPAGPRRGWRR